jgi:hypothetical protein
MDGGVFRSLVARSNETATPPHMLTARRTNSRFWCCCIEKPSFVHQASSHRLSYFILAVSGHFELLGVLRTAGCADGASRRRVWWQNTGGRLMMLQSETSFSDPQQKCNM